MTDRAPITESHVCVPMALAHRLFDCYYGGGPRHAEREARPTVTAFDGQLPQGPPVTGEGSVSDALSLERMRPATMMRGFVPRGVAPGAKTNPPPVGG